MAPRTQVLLLLVVCTHIVVIAALTDVNDLAVLHALKSSWKNLPPNWKGSDPCGSGWEGINCTKSRVTSLKLAGTGVMGRGLEDIPSFTELQFLDLSNNKGLKGNLPPSIGNLKNLTTLILVACSFNGPIPDSIGSLQQLVFLALNSNSFIGSIPPSIGYLSKLSWLDLSDNKLSGSIPVSSGTAPGLDMLLNARHFHLSKNQLSGTIQPQLFSSSMRLIHVIFDNNKLTGEIPPTLGLVKNLEMVRLDSNFLSGSVPPSVNKLKNVTELNLSNNDLTGSLPNLTGMNFLSYVDMSNNSFDVAEFPSWLTDLQSLTTLLMENTQLRGQIPVNFFRLPQLENVMLGHNHLNGTLDLGNSYRSNLMLDLRNNSITTFGQDIGYSMNITLLNNPICEGTGKAARYCTIQKPGSPYIMLPDICTPVACSAEKILSLNCKCAHPYTGTMHFFSFSFSNLENSSYFKYLQGSLMSAFLANQLPVDSVSLSNPTIDLYSYLQFRLQIFPSGQDYFNRTVVSNIGYLLNRQVQIQDYFGPSFFIDEKYCCLPGNKSSNTGVIVGATVGSSMLVLLLLCAGLYAFRQKRKAERAIKDNSPFASWDPDKGNGSIPQLKGARCFSFEELQKCTNNFSEVNSIGSGGYGKVYKGALATGQLVAIKRAQQGSLQGAIEFKAEIELLSRIHHKNVVSLAGFCYGQGEQILVYEYISNGTLKENLSGKSGIRLDWGKRLRVALDSARGLAYLHELANPPIIHRDIKSNNILLDDHLNAKVADFGLSKPISDVAKGHVSTQVKGTMGYMDPEYYMTEQLTKKSDVYSFGIVLLELLTSRAPIQQGRYIVREVMEAMHNSEDPSNLNEVLDPVLRSGPKLQGLDKFVNLAMNCVKESGADRPAMDEVVRVIESIILLNLHNGSASTLPSQDEMSRNDLYEPHGTVERDLYHHVDDDDNSRTFLPFETEHK